jgi:hypothetical protein
MALAGVMTLDPTAGFDQQSEEAIGGFGRQGRKSTVLEGSGSFLASILQGQQDNLHKPPRPLRDNWIKLFS